MTNMISTGSMDRCTILGRGEIIR